MKRAFLVVLCSVLLTILLATSILAQTPDQNPYFYDYLDLELSIQGGFELIETQSNGQVQDARVELLLHPQDSGQQELISTEHDGRERDELIEFTWQEPEIGIQSFGATSLVRTDNVGTQVRTKIGFPIQGIENYLSQEELDLFLSETQNVDWQNPTIIAKANQLASGKDDLFDVVFTLASWVEDNIEYDLNTLTAETSQSSSWVLNSGAGVCDEMTSLFIALTRSLGIPSRFVTGVSYTTSDLFEDPWQAHGWAEIYFPEVGWISFDPTFGEFGFVDVTHIKLSTSVDATSPSTRYEWTAHNVEVEASELDISVEFTGFGKVVENEFSLENEVHRDIVDFGSSNLIKAIIKNENDFYTATRLMLALPDEVEITGKQKQTILLKPKEVKEVYWQIKVTPDLRKNYIYEFPFVIFTERNLTSRGFFSSERSAPFFDIDEIEELIPQEEENSYARRVSSICNQEEYVYLNEESTIDCTVKNSGNTVLEDVEICLDNVCERATIPITQEHTISLDVSFEAEGWKSLPLSIKNEFVDKRNEITIGVLDEANVEIVGEISGDVSYDEDFFITLSATKASFSLPQELEVKIHLPGEERLWQIDALTDSQDLIIETHSKRFGAKNKVKVESTWVDSLGTEQTKVQFIEFEVHTSSFFEKIILFFNGLLL